MRTRRFWYPGTLLPLAALSLATPARANDSPLAGRSVLTLCYQRSDDQPVVGCAFQGEVFKALRQRGAVLVDPAQAERLRRQFAPEQLQTGAELKGVDLLDAELALVLDVRSGEQMRLGKVQSHLVQVSFKLIDVSRAAIVYSHDGSLTAQGLSAQQALVEAAKKFFKAEGARVFAALEQSLAQPELAELWVHDLPELAQVNAVEAVLRAPQLSTGVKALGFGQGLARWRVTLAKGQSPQSLAAALEASEQYLVTQGITGSLVQLARDPAARVKLTVRIDAQADRKMPRWYRDSAVDLAAHRMLAAGWIEVVREPGQPHMATVQLRVRRAGKAGYRLGLTLHDRQGKKLAAVSETALEQDLAEATGRALEKLLGALRQHLARLPGEYSVLQRALSAERGLRLTVQPRDGEVLDAGHLPLYRRDGLAQMQVAPRLDRARARLRLVDLSDWSAWSSAAPATELKLAMPALLTAPRAELDAKSGPTPIQLEVEVEGQIGERLYRSRTVVPQLYWPAQLVRRSRPDSLARFVTPDDPQIRALAAALTPAAGATPSRELGLVAQLWDGLVARGIGLARDAETGPSAGLLAVSSPAAILTQRQTSAASLTLLLATLAEAAGVTTRIVVTPGSLLLAVDSGLPLSAWPLLVQRSQEIVDVEGRLYAVVDAATLGGDLWSALRAGGTALHRAGKQVTLVDPRTAWSAEPPVTWPQTLPPVSGQTEKPARTLVLDLQASATDREQAADLTAELARQLARSPALEVLTGEDLRQLLDAEARRQLTGCDDTSCHTEIAAAAGARFVVHGRLGQVGRQQVLGLSLLDASTARALGREQLKAAAIADLPRALPASSYRLSIGALRALKASCSDPRSWAVHLERLAKQRGKRDAWQKVRLLALAGRPDLAEPVLVKIKPATLRQLGQAHLKLIRGRYAEAQAAYSAVDDPRARHGAQLAAQLAGQKPPAAAGDGVLDPAQAVFALQW